VRIAADCCRKLSQEQKSRGKVYKTVMIGRFSSLFSGKWLRQDLIVRLLPSLLFFDEKSKVFISRIFLSFVRGTHSPYADLRGKLTASVDNLAVFEHKKALRNSFKNPESSKCLQD
jgi:hypothetical protein